MKRVSSVLRISIGLTLLTLSVLFAAQMLDLLPNPTNAILKGRKELCEAVAVQASLAAQRNDAETMRTVIVALAARNTDFLSAAVRTAGGKIITSVGEHERYWTESSDGKSTSTCVRVPIFQGQQHWGTVEIAFKPLTAGGFRGTVNNPVVRFIVFMGVMGFVAYLSYLKKTLSHLDPSAVIPGRVKTMLDTLAEGVLVLDAQERIVLSNEAFAKAVGEPAQGLVGRKASSIAWNHPRAIDATTESPADTAPISSDEITNLPWNEVMRKGIAQIGVPLILNADKAAPRTLMVNCSPILGGDKHIRGAMATFDDVSEIEHKNTQLNEMLQVINQSREEIEAKNRALELLATTDPLTGCLNRRSFFERFEEVWNDGRKRHVPIGVIMVDVDHFKKINDTHGHGVGDDVLKHVASLLREITRSGDLLCRYGGEEFCILLRNAGIEDAADTAERYRSAIETHPCGSVRLTASVGCSSTVLGAPTIKEFVEQADKALYGAKRTGRNRVVRWDAVPENAVEPTRNDAAGTQKGGGPTLATAAPIPFRTVIALTSALLHRHRPTAEHSQRVAEMCVACARGHLSVAECFVLEVAALLHDIGKLGVPDRILLKAGPLTEDEWQVMRIHDQLGVEIVAALASKELTEIVGLHHASFAGTSAKPGNPVGDAIPVGARIMAIADAYDAMINDRVYRQAREPAGAFEELRRCAGKQFDPVWVERFIAAIQRRELRKNPPQPRVGPLELRLEMEKLSAAMTSGLLNELSESAQKLADVAQANGMSQVAQLAGQVRQCTTSEANLAHATTLANELLEVCRGMQPPSEAAARAH